MGFRPIIDAEIVEERPRGRGFRPLVEVEEQHPAPVQAIGEMVRAAVAPRAEPPYIPPGVEPPPIVTPPPARGAYRPPTSPQDVAAVHQARRRFEGIPIPRPDGSLGGVESVEQARELLARPEPMGPTAARVGPAGPAIGASSASAEIPQAIRRFLGNWGSGQARVVGEVGEALGVPLAGDMARQAAFNLREAEREDAISRSTIPLSQNQPRDIPSRIAQAVSEPQNIVDAVSQAVGLGPGMVASGVTRSALPALVQMRSSTIGPEFHRYRETGSELLPALVGAAIKGETEAQPEKIALNYIIKAPIGRLIRGGASERMVAARYLVTAAGLEQTSEAVSAVTGWMADVAMQDPSATPERLAKDVKQAMTQMAVQGPLQAAAGRAGRAVPGMASAIRERIEPPAAQIGRELSRAVDEGPLAPSTPMLPPQPQPRAAFVGAPPADERRALPREEKDPASMTGIEINKELDRLEKSPRENQARIDALYGEIAERPGTAGMDRTLGGPAFLPRRAPSMFGTTGRRGVTNPEEMRAKEINDELDRLDTESSKVTREFIDAGRGSEKPSEYLKKDDPLATRARTIMDRQSALRQEIEARAGPGMRRLPVGQGFGARKKFVGTTGVRPVEATVYRGGRPGAKPGPRGASNTLYYTDSPKVASAYASYPDPEGGKVERARVKLVRPLVIDAKGARWDNIRWTKEQGGDNEWYDVDELSHIGSIRRQHDGIIIKNVRDSAVMRGAKPATTYVVFGRTPIVGTTGRRREFTPALRMNDGRIVEAQDETVHAQLLANLRGRGEDISGAERGFVDEGKFITSDEMWDRIGPDFFGTTGRRGFVGAPPRTDYYEPFKAVTGKYPWEMSFPEFFKRTVSKLKAAQPNKPGEWYQRVIRAEYDKAQDQGRMQFVGAPTATVEDEGIVGEITRLVNQAVDAAKGAQAEFEEFVRRLAANANTGKIIAPVKGVARAVEKAIADYSGTPQERVAQLKDLTRATLVVNSPEEVPFVIERIANVGPTPIKTRNLYDGNATDGYRDGMVVLRAPNGVREVQVNTPEMIEAKEHAHPLMEWRSTIVRRVANESRVATPEEAEVARQLNERMKVIYDGAHVINQRRVSLGQNYTAEELDELAQRAMKSGRDQAAAERERWATILSKVGLSIGTSEAGLGAREIRRGGEESKFITTSVSGSNVTGAPSKSQYSSATGAIIEESQDAVQTDQNRRAGDQPRRELFGTRGTRADRAAGKSAETAIASVDEAVRIDRVSPPLKSRLGKCHTLTWQKVMDDREWRHVIGVTQGARGSDVPIKIWHSVALDPETGNVWEPIADRWYTPDVIVKAFGFEPVLSLSAQETFKLAEKAGVYTDQTVLKPKGWDSKFLMKGDYEPDMSIFDRKMTVGGSGAFAFPILPESVVFMPTDALSQEGPSFEELGLRTADAKTLGFTNFFEQASYHQMVKNEQQAVANAINDAGLADIAKGVAGYFSYDEAATGGHQAVYVPDLNVIGVGHTTLKEAMLSMDGRRRLANYLAHEITHATDHGKEGKRLSGFGRANDYPYFVSAAPATDALDINFDNKVTRNAMGLVSNGVLAQEIFAVMAKGPAELREFFRYPIDNIAAGDMPIPIGKAELVAQVGALYKTKPETVRQWLPSWFDVMEDVYGSPKGETGEGVVAPPKSLVEAHGRLQAALQRAGSIESRARGVQRADERKATGGADRQQPARGPPESRVSVGTRGDAEARPDAGPGGGAARSVVGAPPRPTQVGKYAGNTNLTRLSKLPIGDVKFEDIVDLYNRSVDLTGTRSPRSHSTTQETADAARYTLTELLGREPGQAINAEQTKAARDLLMRLAADVKGHAKPAADGSGIDIGRFAMMMHLLTAAHGKVAGMAAEAGRALNAYLILARAASHDIYDEPQQFPSILKKPKDEAQAGVAETAREPLTAQLAIEALGGYENALKVAREVAAGKNPIEIISKARKRSAETIPPGWLELWKAMLLTNPATHVVNFLGTGLTTAFRPIEALTSAALSIGAKPEDRVYAREVIALTMGMMAGIKPALRAALETIKTGNTPYDKYDHQVSIPGRTGEVVRVPFRLMATGDAFWKAINYTMSLYQLAARETIMGGLGAEGFNSLTVAPTAQTVKRAEDDMNRYTYNKELGKKGRAFQNLVRQVPIIGVVFPFVRTPANIFKFAAERSVFAPIIKEWREDFAAGGRPRREALGRMLTGTALSMLTVSWAAAGMITGGGPPDPERRRRLLEAGWRPYSFKIFGKYYSYRRIEPLGMLMGMAADMWEVWGALDRDETEKLGKMVAYSFANNVTSKTFLQGISDAAKALDPGNPQQFKFFESFAGSVVPAGVAGLARELDPVMRDTKGFYAESDNPLAREFGSFLAKIQSRTPGWSKGLPAQRDIYGEPIEREDSGFISPFGISTAKTDETRTEMAKIGSAVKRPPRTIGGHRLTNAEYEEYQTEAGARLKARLDNFFASGRHEDLERDEQKDAIAEIARQVRREATKDLGFTRTDEEEQRRQTRRRAREAVRE